MIYGPLLFAGRVVRIDPDTGDISTISDEFESPGALKLDSQAAAFVLDEQRVKRVELDTGRTTVVAELPFGADNLALDAEGRLFVSLSEVNAIAEVDVETGEVSYVVEPAPLNSPAGLAVRTEDGRDTLYVGDLFGGVRLVDAETGAVTDTPVDIFQPTHVSLRGDRLLVVGEVFGVVQMLERSGADVLATWEGFTRPGDALEAPNGDVVVAETGSGRVLRIAAGTGDRQVVADGLDAPTGLAWARDGTLYVTETGGGRLLRVDLDTGDTVVEASGLQQPEGVAVDPDGGVLVVEVGAKRLTRILPSDGSQIVIADDLPIGLSNGPSLYRSVAVSSSAIYFNSDVDNTIYRLVPR
jgi:sugar lactone lactonase YvrE